jgi:hypothetical protein
MRQALFNLIGAAIVAAIAFVMIHEPELGAPSSKLQAPSSKSLGPVTYSYADRDMCLDGVLYIENRGKPSTPVFTADGTGVSCEKSSRSLDSFGQRYRPICREGVQYVRFPNIRQPAYFVKMDSSTLLPESCNG